MARRLGVALVGLGAVSAGLLGAYEALLRRPLPQLRGRASLPGLSAAAEVVRDAWNIPHIRAASLADAYAAQGFLQAQDRLFQLELNRRAGAGRLSEMFGAIALPADRFLRRIGLRRAAEVELDHLDTASRALLDAYCAGVNAGMAAAQRWPIEFQLLRLEPEPWTAVDSLGYAKLLAWTLSGNWESELLRARLVQRLGADQAARLDPPYPRGFPLVAPPEAASAVADLLEDYERASDVIALFAAGASNAWAVDGAHSASGKPLLASDPHLGLQQPPTWYELHLTSPGGDVAGGSLVGLPGIFIGHNGHVAWGLTAAPVDVQDLYLERFHVHDRARYEVNGDWQMARLIGEVIKVKGQAEPVVEEVRVTRHGPIITPLRTTTAALALRWVSHGADNLLPTITGVNLARDWPEVQAVLAGLVGPPINLVAADTAGTIAYQQAGQVPSRPGRGGLLPVPGWTDQYEWGPPIPFDELPRAVNPPGGMVISANHRVMADDYPHYLGHDWSNGYRAARIAELLTAKERHTVADFVRIQGDVQSLPGLRLQACLTGLPPEWVSPATVPALDLLRAWDGEMRAESGGAAVYGRLMPTVLRRLLGPSLGPLLEEFLGLAQHEIGTINLFWGRAIPHALDLLDDPALGGLPTEPADAPPGATPAEALLLAALEETAGDLRRLLGPNPATWRWGSLHRVAWRHPLGAIKPLAPLLNRGPYELPGDADTVNQASTVPFPPTTESTHAWVPAYRMVVDLGDTTRSVALLAGGESGQPGSPHYGDQIGAWRSGRYHALLYNRNAIDKAAVHRLLLMPEEM